MAGLHKTDSGLESTMLDTQVARLRAKYPKEFNLEQAATAVARAYGYKTLDTRSWELGDPMQGLQHIKSHDVMLSEDAQHQAMHFMRMALNLSLSYQNDVRQGVPEREIVAALGGFSSFDSLINYARSDPIDPNTTDRAILAKFKQRFGYYAPIQYVLGRYIHEHCLIIQPDEEKARRFVDQEVVLNPTAGTKVVIFRDNPHGGDWLSVVSKGIAIYRAETDSTYDVGLRKAFSTSNVVVAIAPPETFSLKDVVALNIPAMMTNSPDGRALIVDVENLNTQTSELDAAYSLASASGVHLVVIVRQPNAELWKRSGIRLIFGFDPNIKESYLDMDKYIGYSAPYVGFKRNKMQYLYQSEDSGPRFGAMDLIPDDTKTKSLLDRMKEAIRG
ncbi:hypothetical protein ASC85_08710 [Pseudomonas sp. Root401]|nr:hypothetical protein ASC85_08710 [Pseudomonas sp. Root401]